MRLTNVAEKFTNFDVQLEPSCLAGVTEVGDRILRHAISHLVRTRGAGIDQADLAALDVMARAMRMANDDAGSCVERVLGFTGCPRISFREIWDVGVEYFEMDPLNRLMSHFVSFES